jgi:hypothetical protein
LAREIILSRASFILIFLSSSNDKEVDVKRDGQGKCAAGRLETRTAPAVSGFLERLNKLPHLERWQVEQAGAALASLYEEVLRIDLGKIELTRARGRR